MNSELSQIDRIVREVIRRLEQPSSGAAVSTPVAAMPDATTLRIEDRVVTGDLLNGRLENIRRVEVRHDAVVTPLVRDLLREKDVQLHRVTQRRGKTPQRWLLVEQQKVRAEALHSQLTANDEAWTLATDWQQLIDSVAAGDVAVVVTSAWAARVCQANRHETVRAVHVVDLTSLEQALEQADANLLVVNADQVDEAAVVQIALQFVGSSKP